MYKRTEPFYDVRMSRKQTSWATICPSSQSNIICKTTTTANCRTCIVPRAQNSFRDRDFSVAGPRIWNDLPPELQQPDISFGQLKTCWNRISLDFSQPRRIVTFWLLRLRISLTYLLTYLQATKPTYTSYAQTRKLKSDCTLSVTSICALFGSRLLSAQNTHVSSTSSALNGTSSAQSSELRPASRNASIMFQISTKYTEKNMCNRWISMLCLKTAHLQRLSFSHNNKSDDDSDSGSEKKKRSKNYTAWWQRNTSEQFVHKSSMKCNSPQSNPSPLNHRWDILII